MVSFHPKGQDHEKQGPSTGLTGDDGTFNLFTGSVEGAPTGKYVVTFYWPIKQAVLQLYRELDKAADESSKEQIREKIKAENGKIAMEPAVTVDAFGGAYSNQQTSKFEVEVAGGANNLKPFEL